MRSAALNSSSSSAVDTVSTNSSSTQLAAGVKVEHSQFGRGEVLAVEGSGMDTKATVRFDNVGTNQLLLRFAKIKVVG